MIASIPPVVPQQGQVAGSVTCRQQAAVGMWWLALLATALGTC